MQNKGKIRGREETKIWVPVQKPKIWYFIQNSILMGAGGCNFFLFVDYQAHKMKLKFKFLVFAVMSRDCKTQFDMTAQILLAL